MVKIEKFIFNPFQENTYILFDETKDCVIIDPGCLQEDEQNAISRFIELNELKVVHLIFTHCHVDHIFGTNYIAAKYTVKPRIHSAGLPIYEGVIEHAKMYGFDIEPLVAPNADLIDGMEIRFGNSVLQVAYTPGHADGSVCFISNDNTFVITGDVLFKDSIGRTDFPTGDFDILMESIHQKLFTLDDDFVVYPGHGPETSIGYEKVNNPFIRF
jgi:glyoxylase-like metal-dependent hydrolase (beta-lactamase superfamily II)